MSVEPEYFQYPDHGENYHGIQLNRLTFSGGPLAIGDEIGVFCDTLGNGNWENFICVGAVATPLNSNQLLAWKDNSITHIIDGFLSDAQIYFKLWDKSKNEEINIEFIEYLDIGEASSTEGVFDLEKISVVNISANLPQHFTYTETGSLTDGFELINVNSALLHDLPLTEGDEIGVFDDDLCVGAIRYFGEDLQPMYAWQNGYTESNPITFKYFTFNGGSIIDANAEFIEFEHWDTSGLFNNEGYWQCSDQEFITQELCEDHGLDWFWSPTECGVNLTGEFSGIDQDISLITGWNIMSFYNEPTDMNLQNIVQSLIDAGTLLKVQDESGSAIEDLGFPIGWVNNIGNFEADEGYYIKVSTDTVIELDESSLSLLRVADTRDDPQHFTPVYDGNPYLAMNLYALSGVINGENLTSGDEIGIFDGDYCVGVGVLDGEIGDIFQMVAATDDPSTPEVVDGFTTGNEITFKLWDASEGIEVTDVVATYNMGDGTFSSQGTATFDINTLGVNNELELTDYELMQCYPNPFNPTITIRFTIPTQEKRLVTSLKIYNLQAQLSETLINQQLDAGYHQVVWDATSYHSGIYFVKLVNRNFTQSKKLILLK